MTRSNRLSTYSRERSEFLLGRRQERPILFYNLINLTILPFYNLPFIVLISYFSSFLQPSTLNLSPSPLGGLGWGLLHDRLRWIDEGKENGTDDEHAGNHVKGQVVVAR